MARMTNGGFVGKAVTVPTKSVAVGKWNSVEQHIYRQQDVWAADINKSGLIAYYDAANSNSYPGTGTTWYDISGNVSPLNMTLVNSPSYSTSNGGHFIFNGSSNYAYTDISSKINTNTFTISCWATISTSPSSNYYGIFGTFEDTPSSYVGGSIVVQNSQSVAHYLIGWSGGGAQYMPAASSYSTNTWYHFTGVTAGNTSTFYINGVQQGSTYSQTISAPSNSRLKFGKFYYATNDYFHNGKIASGYMYNRALLSSEVLENFNIHKSRYGY